MKIKFTLFVWQNFLCLFFVFFVQIAFCQTTVSLIDNEIRSLNGGVRAGMGGRSRVTIPIRIPQHAVGLVYTIQAYRSSETPEALNLALAIGTLYTTGSPALASLASKLQIPISTQTVDAYILTSQKDESMFVAKNDGYWSTYSLADRQACVNCKVSLEFKPVEQDQIVYLALRNPSALEAIKIQVNAVAIVP